VVNVCTRSCMCMQSNEEDLVLTGGEPPLRGSPAKQQEGEASGATTTEQQPPQQQLQQQDKPQGAGYSCHTGAGCAGHVPEVSTTSAAVTQGRR
jgi:hypothetical protein